jgi:hypothetical protein
MQQTIFTSKYFDSRISVFNIDSIKDLENKKKLINRWIAAFESGNLSFSKETQIDITFLNDIFGEVLDYEYEIDKQRINLIPKSSIESKEPDAILGFFSQQDRKDIRAIIELKDSKNDLDRVQNRLEKISPVTQAFEYARKAGENCKWVIVSNIQTIRLYNKESDRYEIFNLIDLKDVFHLKRLFFLLHKDRLFFQSGESFVDILYRERLEEEQKIEKEFYSAYHSLRTKLFEYLVANNEKIESAILLEKTQKILDRIIFVCFCADLEIIPSSIIKQLKANSNPVYKFYDNLVWIHLKSLFTALDLGNSNLTKLNGGLFEEDEILNSLKIADKILLDVLTLAEYDYRSDLNVNILGHIFEQSISDIEKMKQNLLEFNKITGLNGEQNGKRKAYGIFYTPENITKYLVKETIANWLDEQKEKLGENELPILTDKDYDLIKITKQGTLRTNDRIEKNKLFWEKYFERLLAIKILDPACGSGAFLVECLNFLITEYRNVQKELRLLNPPIPPDEYKSKLKQELTFNLQKSEFDIEEHILRNNLYGVDINFESVEITRLALWLKTVKRGKILTDIDYNIQQGNSLISDEIIAGNLAFDWNRKFKKILESGGFDIIIGNPPYVTKLQETEILYFQQNYTTIQGKKYDLFRFFIEKGLKLLKENGYLGYITPDVFLNLKQASKLREYILSNYSLLSISHAPIATFDASVEPVIFIIKNAKLPHNSSKLVDLKTNSILKEIDQSLWLTGDNNIDFKILESDNAVLKKLQTVKLVIKDVMIWKKGLGVYSVQHLSNKFPQEEVERIMKERPWTKDYKADDTFGPELIGADIGRYFIQWNEKHWLSYGNWLAFQRPIEFFSGPRILVREITTSGYYNVLASYVEDLYYNNQCMFNGIMKSVNYNIKFILGLINSRLFSFYVIQTAPKNNRKLFPTILMETIELFPLIDCTKEEQAVIVDLVEKQLTITMQIEKIKSKFINRIITNFKIPKISNNLYNFMKLTFSELKNDLKKNKIELSYKQQDELEIYFMENKNQIDSMIKTKESIDKEIDNLIYELYKITKKEIELIERQ